MSITIQTIKDGEILETRNWNEGHYTIGRDESCDIWLDDPHISLTHAELDVEKNKVTIHDMRSKNGIFFNDEKIEKKKTFKNNFDVELGPYIVKGIFQAPLKPIVQDSAILQNRLFANINVLLTVSLIFMVVLASLTVFIFMNHQTQSFQEAELRKRGNLFSLYLAKLAGTDDNAIILDAEDQRLIKNIAGEEGVIFAVIANREGRIEAPESEKEKKVQWDGFQKAIQEKERTNEDIDENQKIIFYPIKNEHKVLGGAVIKLDMRKVTQSGMGVYFSMILFVLIIFCILTGRYVTRLFLMPLHRLGEEVSVAMKAKRRRIDFHSPHPEIAELTDMFNRLLQNSQGIPVNTAETDIGNPSDSNNETDDKYSDFEEQPEPPGPALSATSSENDSTPAFRDDDISVSRQSDTGYQNGKTIMKGSDNNETANSMNTDTITEPQCIIDVNTFMLVDCNKPFVNHFSRARTPKDLNFAEIFEEPLISNAVYELLVGSEKEASVAISDTCNYVIKKKGADDKKGLITISFKESQHG